MLRFSLSLELQDRIALDVTHIDFRTELLHVRMLLAQQPAHVSEEEAALDVMWIGVCVAKFVVNSMVAHPLDHIVLRRHRLHEHQHDAHLKVGLKSSMRPQTMRADSRSPS